MGAFSKDDRELLADDQRRRIADRLNLDQASRDEHPFANRWDYSVAIPDTKELAGIEPRHRGGLRGRRRHRKEQTCKRLSAVVCLAAWDEAGLGRAGVAADARGDGSGGGLVGVVGGGVDGE